MQEILVILVLALIFLGPKKLPELASGIGKAIREVRKATADIKSEIELDDVIRKPLEELREATMLPPEELKRRDEERKWRAEREKQDKLDQEARDRGEVVPGDAVADEYHHDTEHDDDYHEAGDGYDDPQSHAPDDSDTVSAPSASGAKGKPGAKLGDDKTGELNIKDLEQVSVLPTPATAATKSPSRTNTPPLPPSALPPSAVGEKTIAMTLPPPMEGSSRSTLPPPRPASAPSVPPRSTPALGSPVAKPGVTPAVGDKTLIDPVKPVAPAGAVPRPNTQTLFGVQAPKVPAAPAPAAPASKAPSSGSGSATAPKPTTPPAKKPT